MNKMINTQEEKSHLLKRKRSLNWSEEDKLLKELVRNSVKEIENKNADSNTNSTKKKKWLEIMECFNNMCSDSQRNVDQLKTQWAATKIVARKQAAGYRKELLKTGGGSHPPELPVSGNDISVWLPDEFVVDCNKFDSDFVKEKVTETEVNNDIVYLEEPDDDDSRPFTLLKEIFVETMTTDGKDYIPMQ